MGSFLPCETSSTTICHVTRLCDLTGARRGPPSSSPLMYLKRTWTFCGLLERIRMPDFCARNEKGRDSGAKAEMSLGPILGPYSADSMDSERQPETEKATVDTRLSAKENPEKHGEKCDLSSSRGRTRTGTGRLAPRDFKSLVSTIPPRGLIAFFPATGTPEFRENFRLPRLLQL
jgi:hypothetical protein